MADTAVKEEVKAEAAAAPSAETTAAAPEAEPKVETAAAESSGAMFVPGAPSDKQGQAPQTEEEKEAAIRKQVEYYFSDTNFRKDKFLQIETAKSDEQWINISVLNTFNRMKILVPSLKPEPIASALKSSEVVEISECGTKIRRHKSLWGTKPVELGGKSYSSRNEVISRVQPLLKTAGTLSDEDASFVKDLLKHHATAAAKEGPGIAAIKVGSNPKFPDTKCFVLVRVDGTEEDFSYLKCVANIFPDLESSRVSTRKRKADATADEPNAKRGPAAGSSGDGDTESAGFKKGTIVLVRDLPEDQTVASMKSAFGVAGLVRYVEMVPDQPLAYVRYETAEHAQKALEIGGMGTLSILDGDDEKEYWDKIDSTRDCKGRGGGRGGGRGRGRGGKGKGKGKGGGRGRRGGRGGD